MDPTKFPHSFKEALAQYIGRNITIFFNDGSLNKNLLYVGEDYLVTATVSRYPKGTPDLHFVPFSSINFITLPSKDYSGHD